jgi:hypothetical protein
MHRHDSPHTLDHVEQEAVSTRWCVVCDCGWRSEYRARTFLWTRYTAHLGLDLDDREGRLAVMYAVAAGVAEAESAGVRSPAGRIEGLNYPVFACVADEGRTLR